MPGSLLTADTNFPDLSKKESTADKLEAVSGYLYMLLEQLRYTLANLGEENFNSAELDHIGKVITEPLTVRVEETEGELTELTVTVSGVSSRVQNLSGRFSVVEQDINGLNVQTIQGTTCITGDHVKTGKLVSQNGMSEIDLNTGEASLSGSYRVTNPETQEVVGGIRYDTNGAGTASEAKNRMFLYTDNKYAMKLESASRVSIEGKQLIYISSDGEATINVGGTMWSFRNGGIYCNGTLAVPNPNG